MLMERSWEYVVQILHTENITTRETMVYTEGFFSRIRPFRESCISRDLSTFALQQGNPKERTNLIQGSRNDVRSLRQHLLYYLSTLIIHTLTANAYSSLCISPLGYSITLKPIVIDKEKTERFLQFNFQNFHKTRQFTFV